MKLLDKMLFARGPPPPLPSLRRYLATKIKSLLATTETSSMERPRRIRIHSDYPQRRWESVIGLEVHAQIASESKLFSAAAAAAGSHSSPTNCAVSFFDAALPGTLPALNRRCVEAALRAALALNCNISSISSFDRKHYFYADLPAGYQITQQRQPLAKGGSLDFTVLRSATAPLTYRHRVGIHQLQLEQDSGKSLHDDVGKDGTKGQTLVDLNRAGVGLMEIVFEPELFDGEEAAALIKELSLILQLLGTCSCRMEDGALRVDANISVRPVVDDPNDVSPLGVRTEIKNLNSIRSVVRAIEYEVDRQIKILAEGGEVVNETRSFDFATKITLPMRDKEAKQDYRFMPEPNLPPLRFVQEGKSFNSQHVLDIAAFRSQLPELPGEIRRNLIEKHGVSVENAYRLVNEPLWLDFFNRCLQLGPKQPNAVANMLVIEVAHQLETAGVDLAGCHLTPRMLVDVADMKSGDELPHNLLRLALTLLVTEHHESLEAVVKEKRWRETARDEVRIAGEITRVMRENPKLVKMCFKGKERGYREMLDILSKQFETELDMAMVAKMLRQEILAQMDP